MTDKPYRLRRDPLDYLLTDTLPVEISELFTYSYLYNYLHRNKIFIDEIIKQIKEDKNSFANKKTPFERGWLTTPLTYNIVKKDSVSLRKMSIPQPVSALNMYYFIDLYQKDLLGYLDEPDYSIRYPKRNSDLFYKNTNRNSLIHYQYKRNRRNKKAVEQSGRYFDIFPFSRPFDLQRHETWRIANLRFKRICRLDYKRCFDSIYTHSYKWIVTRDVIDSKAFKNSSIFAVIDRILQNINGASSNGVLVGPEFSRLVVEVLLQTIDKEVFNELIAKQIKQHVDYEIMRYVDDIFIFTNNEDTEELILKKIDEKAASYLLEINKLKTEKQSTPFKKYIWLRDVEAYRDKLNGIFRSNKAIEQAGEDFQIACKTADIQRLKDEFEYIIANYKTDSASITAYLLSSVTNFLSANVSKEGQKYKFFKSPNHKSIRSIIDFLFYIYCHSINFNNTQKLISALYYFHYEVDLQASANLQAVITKYEQNIVSSNYADYINLWIVFGELNVNFSSTTENILFSALTSADDPIGLATLLAYAKYDDDLMESWSNRVNQLLKVKFNAIRKPGQELQYREFWYVLVFYKCPYLSEELEQQFKHLLKKMAQNPKIESADKTIALIARFLLDPKEKYGFISWNIKGARMLEEITYRTNQKTVFRRGASSIEFSV